MTHQEMEIRIKELQNQVKALEQELTTERIEYGTDGNRYVLSMTNGKELERDSCEDAVNRQAVLDYIYNGLGLGDEENGNDVERQMELERSYKYVKSLPPVNPQPCEDAISRQAVLESIKNLYPDMPVVDIMGSRRKWLARYAPYFECENAVKHLPPVNSQVKTGHWTIKENGHVKCSKCLVVQPYSSIFCPNCGARMVEL